MVFGKGRPKVSGNNSVEIPVHTPQMPKIINGKFLCPFSECKQEHLIDDVNNLINDKSSELFYKKNTKQICSTFYEVISAKYKNLEGILLFAGKNLN